MGTRKPSSYIRGFDVIGDVAVVRAPKGTNQEVVRRFAAKIMRDNRHIKGVFKKVGRTEGEERVPRIVWVAGSRNHTVVHKENGCIFSIDIKKAFFTPRLSSERLRIAKLVKSDETVLDMFCGVGPYTILISRKAREVYAIDVNENAVQELRKNITMNKARNVKAFQGDSKKAVGKLGIRFDRIIMNFPVASYEFLPAALKVARNRCVIHLYTFIETKDGYAAAVEKAKEEVMRRIPEGVAVIMIDARRAGEVAPYMIRECLDIHIKRRGQGNAL